MFVLVIALAQHSTAQNCTALHSTATAQHARENGERGTGLLTAPGQSVPGPVAEEPWQRSRGKGSLGRNPAIPSFVGIKGTLGDKMLIANVRPSDAMQCNAEELTPEAGNDYLSHQP